MSDLLMKRLLSLQDALDNAQKLRDTKKIASIAFELDAIAAAEQQQPQPKPLIVNSSSLIAIPKTQTILSKNVLLPDACTSLHIANNNLQANSKPSKVSTTVGASQNDLHGGTTSSSPPSATTGQQHHKPRLEQDATRIDTNTSHPRQPTMLLSRPPSLSVESSSTVCSTATKTQLSSSSSALRMRAASILNKEQRKPCSVVDISTGVITTVINDETFESDHVVVGGSKNPSSISPQHSFSLLLATEEKSTLLFMIDHLSLELQKQREKVTLLHEEVVLPLVRHISVLEKENQEGQRIRAAWAKQLDSFSKRSGQ